MVKLVDPYRTSVTFLFLQMMRRASTLFPHLLELVRQLAPPPNPLSQYTRAVEPVIAK